MYRNDPGVRLAGAVVLLSVFAVACGPEGPAGVSVGPEYAVGDRNDNYNLEAGLVNVCAFIPVGAPPLHVAEFSASATGGDVIDGVFTLSNLPPLCIEVWNPTDATTVDVTGTLVSAPAGFALDRIVTLTGDGVGDATGSVLLGVNSATVPASDAIGSYIWFKFEPQDEPPSSGGEGCTPGYWRQAHHFHNWPAPYTPTTLFSDVFEDAFPGLTLLDVVWLRGGGLNALGRHTVAALLSAGAVDYDYTPAEVIDAFNAVYPGGDYESLKNLFDFLNNQGCPL